MDLAGERRRPTGRARAPVTRPVDGGQGSNGSLRSGRRPSLGGGGHDRLPRLSPRLLQPTANHR